ncbi:MAG: hypothetical protein ACHQVS_02350 [Candidatus Babeliales bacterium]
MKVSNTIKKVVVVSVFCSQAITLYPMQEAVQAAEPRQTRGLSVMSVNTDVTFPGSVNPEESLPRESEAERTTARQTRLDTLFYGEGDTIINVPKTFQDEQDPANLDQVTKLAIAQDEDKDGQLIDEQLKRKAIFAARGLSLDQEQSTFSTRPSAIAIEMDTKTQADTPATQADVDTKVEKANQLTNKINGLIDDTKQLMSKAKGHLVQGLERGAYLIAAANVVMIIWSSIDAARNTETLPYLVYILDAALIVLTATAQILHSAHNKLKQEVEDEFIPEDYPGSIPNPQPMSFRQRLTNKLSHYWSNVTNCLSKIAATHLITGAALASAGITFVAAKWPETVSPIAAEWIDNGENILDGLIIGWLVFSKVAVNKLYALRAKKELERRASADGKVHQKIELNTLPDRRDSLNPVVQVIVNRPMHGTKGSIEMVSSLPEESPITMVVNPLAALETERGTTETESETPTPDKEGTPEKRHSSDKEGSSGKPSPALQAQRVHPAPTQLDFNIEAELAV